MWNHYEYLLIIFLPLCVFVAIFLSVWLAKKQTEVIHSMSSYVKDPPDENALAKAEYLNEQLKPLGLVYNVKFDLFYSTDNEITADKIKRIRENNPDIFELIKEMNGIKSLL